MLHASRLQTGAGDLTGGTIPDMAFTRQFQTLGAVPKIANANEIDLNAQNLGAVTINVKRAHVGCNVKLNVTSDGPVAVTLAPCGTTQNFGG